MDARFLCCFECAIFLHHLNSDITTIHGWSFTFEIHHPSVFYDGISGESLVTVIRWELA